MLSKMWGALGHLGLIIPLLSLPGILPKEFGLSYEAFTRSWYITDTIVHISGATSLMLSRDKII